MRLTKNIAISSLMAAALVIGSATVGITGAAAEAVPEATPSPTAAVHQVDEPTAAQEVSAPAATASPAPSPSAPVEEGSAGSVEQQRAPKPTSGATLTISKLGERTSSGGVTALGGATFFAVPGAERIAPSLDDTSSYTCTTDASGQCEIVVPAVTGSTTTGESGYWIVEGTAPAGWDRIELIGTGQHTAAKRASTYTFFTGNVSDGEVVAVTADTTAYANPETGDTTATTDADGVVNSRENPTFPATCGLSIALIMDASQSINATEMAQMKDAARSFVGFGELGGTASSVAIYGFQTRAQKVLDSTSIVTSSGQATVEAAIDSFPASGSGFTNWDDAFREVAFNAEGERYDLVILLSDGDPTTYADGSQIETDVSFENVEEAVLSANAVKAQTGPSSAPTKVVGVGIGLAANSYLNLVAVSGEVEGEDYFLTDFDQLAAILADIATKACGGTLTVVKKTLDESGAVIDEAADGWTFTASTDGPGIVGPDGPVDELSQVTTGGGATFDLDITGVDRTVGVVEDVPTGWTPVDVACTGATPTGSAADFEVTVPRDRPVSCVVTNQRDGVAPSNDISLEKTALSGGTPLTSPLEAGDTFEYVLTVTNTGTREAADVVVTDAVPERLTVTGVSVPTGWTNDNAPDLVDGANGLSVSVPSMAANTAVEIQLAVTVDPAPIAPVEHLQDGDPVPQPTLPVTTLINDACVEASTDSDPTNNCDDVTVELKEIAAIVYTRCVADAPMLGFSLVKTENLRAEPLAFSWTPDSGTATTEPPSVSQTYPGGEVAYADELPWPGAAFTPSGVSIDYPGWRPLELSDFAPGGGYYIPGTTTVMTPAQEQNQIFNGLILDDSELDYAWRLDTTVVLAVNPEQTFAVSYPPATAECTTARYTEVDIQKTASVEQTDPGASFTYALAVENVSDDAAAEGVVVTDDIPSTLRITDVTWPGQGDADAFPTWESCEVGGQASGGYGGTLTCVLFGPLQPRGANSGASAAPTITLAATVAADAPAGTITNVGVVDYHTFGDPNDAGRSVDDAVVQLGALPVTGGGDSALRLIPVGVLVLVIGVVALWIGRRRVNV